MSTPSALITGASRGIGLAVARALAPQMRIIAHGRDAHRLEVAVEELRALGGPGVEPWVVDLGDPQARATAIDALVSRERVENLINNAGIAPSGPLSRSPDSVMAQCLEVNLRAPYALCQALMPKMAKATGGRVVNIASTAALKGYAYTAAYSASKAGLLGLTRALAVEYAKKGVTINAVCPGFTDTDIVAAAVQQIESSTSQSAEQARASLASFSPAGRLIEPEEVAAAVSYLLSPAARGVNGLALTVDGGECA